MKTARTFCQGIALLLAATATAIAQPVLEDVERNVRRQVGVPALNPADAEIAPRGAQPGYLGVLADDRGEEGRGIRIRELLPGGPAADGGLQVGDLLTAINGRPIRTMDDMIQTLAPVPAGQRVEFQVNRSGATQKISVVLGSRPAKADRRFPDFGKQPEDLPAPADRRAAGEAPLGAPNGPLLGVRTLPATPELRRRFKVAVDTDGALITAVTVGSPADKIGLSPGMLITAINGQPVNSPDAVSALVRQAGPGREIELTYWDKTAQLRQRVTLAGAGDAARVPAPQAPVPPAPSNFTPEPPPPAAAPPRAESATEALERRIQQLESRLDKLEAALRKE
jgi:S1-C subfamily serine protease